MSDADQSIRARLEKATLKGLDVLEEYGEAIHSTLRDDRESYELAKIANPRKDGAFKVGRHIPPRDLTRAVTAYGKVLGQLRMDQLLRDKLALDGRALETLTDEQYRQGIEDLGREALTTIGNDTLLRELERRGMAPKLPIGMLSPGAEIPK